MRGERGEAVGVSIIIPTYNRAAQLDGTLESLVVLDYPVDRLEIIVADNNSRDGTRDVVEKWSRSSPVKIVYLFEERQGVHYARNSAAKAATGDLLYFTDDDMVADRDLLKNLVPLFNMGNHIAVATGRVLPRWEVEPPRWIRRYFQDGTLSLNDRREELIISADDEDTGVYSCHQAIRCEVFLRSGGFNPENTAGEWVGDGETGLNRKIRVLGYSFAFTGGAVTYHCIPQERMTQRYINRRMANQGSADSYTAYQEHASSPAVLRRQVLFHGLQALRHTLRFLLKLALGKESWRVDRGKVSYFARRMRYDVRLLRDEEWCRLVLKTDWLSE